MSIALPREVRRSPAEICLAVTEIADPGVIDRVELVPTDPKTSWTCTNCGAPYPLDAEACPACGVK